MDADTQGQGCSKEYLDTQGGKLVSSTRDTHLFMFTTHKKSLLRRRWDFYPNQPGEYSIESTFSAKKFIKHKRGDSRYISDWQPGINLLTFKTLNGIYPHKKTIREHIEPLKGMKHNDMKIFNLVIQGTKIHPIDCNEKGRNFNTAKQVELIVDCFRNNPAVARGMMEEDDHLYDLSWLYEDDDIDIEV